MKIALVTMMSVLWLIGCGTKQVNNTTGSSEQPKPQTPPEKVVFDTKKPTSFAEYKQWRQLNDPNSETYAEFKAWEIKQREWKIKNEQ